MTNYREKLRAFIEDLNVLLSDKSMLPKEIMGRFKIEAQTNLGQYAIGVFFEEGGINHCIYLHKYYINKSTPPDYENDLWRRAYWETIRTGFIGFDNVGQLEDVSTGCKIHILNFHTLMTEGLKKIREYNELKKSTK